MGDNCPLNYQSDWSRLSASGFTTGCGKPIFRKDTSETLLWFWARRDVTVKLTLIIKCNLAGVFCNIGVCVEYSFFMFRCKLMLFSFGKLRRPLFLFITSLLYYSLGHLTRNYYSVSVPKSTKALADKITFPATIGLDRMNVVFVIPIPIRLKLLVSLDSLQCYTGILLILWGVITSILLTSFYFCSWALFTFSFGF
jgi:hypothetical protein